MTFPLSHGSPGNDQTVLEPGVHYVCQRCNACCKWPGDVRVSEGEIAAIADFLEMPEDDFISGFTRLRTNRKGQPRVHHAGERRLPNPSRETLAMRRFPK